MRMTFIDFFAGIGGFHSGFEKAGMKCIGWCEFDKYAQSQDVSIAGKQKGIKRGTRSGLFFEIMRLIDEAEENKPRWIIAENVKNLLSIEGGVGILHGAF